MLDHPGRIWSVRGLAAAAGVTPMLSSDIVRRLEIASIVSTQPAGRELRVTLVDPNELLRQWVSVYSYQRNQRIAFAVPVPRIDRMADRIRQMVGSRRWAFTLLGGAWERIRHAPTERIHAYVEASHMDEIRQCAANQGWGEDPAGQLILMKPVYRHAVWHGMREALLGRAPVVSDLQLVLDLWHFPDRGREVAEQLWRRLMHPFENVRRD